MSKSKPPFSQVWSLVTKNAGQKFITKNRLPFTYQIEDNGFFPSRTAYRISRSDFERAYKLVPLAGPGQINQLVRGPAYVWAVLHDQRISLGAW